MSMNKRKFLALLSILAALILAMVTIVPASADQPVHKTYTWEKEFV
jgi:hypothetical protein